MVSSLQVFWQKFWTHLSLLPSTTHPPPQKKIITLTIFGDGYKLWSSLLPYNFLKPSVASSPTVQICTWPPCSISLLINILQHGWPTRHLMPIQKSNNNLTALYLLKLYNARHEIGRQKMFLLNGGMYSLSNCHGCNSYLLLLFPNIWYLIHSQRTCSLALHSSLIKTCHDSWKYSQNLTEDMGKKWYCSN